MGKWKRGAAGLLAGILVWLTCFPYLPVMPVRGAVVFGELEYDEGLVAVWDGLAAGAGLERTDMQNHYTSTYPKPKVIATVKQQTGRSASGKWKDWEYRNVYCIAHSGEAANNPVSSMVCSSVWYAGQPWTLQALPEYMRAQAGGDEYRLRFNFLMLAYGAGYRAKQNGVNSDSIVGTADYYLCQGICTLTEEAQFTGIYENDWGIYEPIVMDWASRFHPNSNGSSKVYEDMKANARELFDRVWHTAKLAAACTRSGDDGFIFQPTILLESDGMFHARFPMVPEVRPMLAAAAVRTQGDWQYRLDEAAVDFWSPSGEIPSCGYLAELDLSNANGIVRASIGAESVRELHQPVQVRGNWSLTYSQANLVSSLIDGIRIVVGTPEEPSPSVDFSGGSVVRYRHREQWQADYAVGLRKLDAETGKPLEGAQFDILEAFDSSQLDGSILEDDNWDNDRGSQFLRWEGWDAPYEERGDEPCRKDQEITDEDGWLTEMESAGAGPLKANGKRAHHDVKYYSYTKGYCGGHPEPDSEDEDEEAMEEYEREIAVCEALAAEGGFFHSLEGGADQLLADRDRHYQEFISLTYDYSAKELTARDGYILHNKEQVHAPHEMICDGIHNDTISVETVTVHASQYGGNQIIQSEEAVGPASVERKEIVKTSVSMGAAENWYIPDEDATPSDADTDDENDIDLASGSDAMASDVATVSNAVSRRLSGMVLAAESGKASEENTERAAERANVLREGVGWSTSPLAAIPKGDTEYGGAGAAWIFEVYDHRTEGEVHINKRDLALKNGENGTYDSYGDTQADATLQGAVYGLFAAEDIDHPDGKTGVVYEKDNLTAIATTDPNGDASFLAYTEVPGSVYDYEQGKIVHTLEQENGSFWIGRPLILGSYYVQELTRSEGYELSVYGIDAEITNRTGWEQGGDVSARGEAWLEQIEEQVLYDDVSGMNRLTTQMILGGRDSVHGYDLMIRGLDPAAGPSFSSTVVGTKEVLAQWQEPILSCEPVEAEPGTRVILNGSSVEAQPGELISLPNGETAVAEYVETGPVSGERRVITGAQGSIPAFDLRYIPELTGIDGTDRDAFLADCNQAFAEVGLEPVGEDAPYCLIDLGDAPEEWAEKLYAYFCSETRPCFNGASLECIVEQDGKPYAVLRYSFLKHGEAQSVLYSVSDHTFYVRYDVVYRGRQNDEGLNGEQDAGQEGYLYRAYPAETLEEQDYEVGNRLYRWIRIANERPEKAEAGLYEDLSELAFVSAQEFRSYWVYGPGEYLRGEDGSIYQKEQIRYETRTGYHIEESYQDTPLEFTYQDTQKAYAIHIAPERIGADGKLMISIRYEDVFAGGRTGLSVSVKPSMDVTGTYIRPVVLSYPGQTQIYEDAGTRAEPVSVSERVIQQKTEVVKTIEQEEPEESAAMGNFRFKIYLKSNLERLYRDEAGTIVWVDRNGQALSQQEQLERKNIYPALVPVIDTRKPDGEAGDEEEGYMALLEPVGYEQFFDAIAVANHDKWDDAAPTYTSWHPIGNQWKRSEATLDNARVSDAVRQFAVDWYLDDAVDKLQPGTAAFTDQFYDEALQAAIRKAKDYLKPFFAYDLDEIYAIAWDSEADGGSDGDPSTLSADLWKEGSCSGVSRYLPYGTYVVVEQQPQVDALGDFRNKHFHIDHPKEVVIPSVYAGDDDSSEEPDLLQERYTYDADAPSEELERQFRIRYQEESRVVKAHSNAGDFETYPYGKTAEIGGMQDRVRTMTGMQTAYDGEYAPMLVPWSVVDHGDSSTEAPARVRFYNRKYRARLRLEKLDAQTHENILHDRAVFCIYKAKRNEEPDGDGAVLFYEEPTLVKGTQEFLLSLKAEHIQPAARAVNFWQRLFAKQMGPGTLYTGMVPAGTPICEEKDLVVADAKTWLAEASHQTVGYLETDQPLEAGTYVICEMKPPSGYVRSDPIAVEIYSDQVTYYKEGSKDLRVLAVRCQDDTEARIYVENEPIQLQVEKKKEAEATVTYRVYGSLAYLRSRQEAGEQIELVYNGKAFAGYGYVTRQRTQEENPYTAGARMALFEALELKPTGDTEDYAYEGLIIERNAANQVVRMYVKEGFAGETTVYTDVVNCPDTDILYYPLDGLDVTETAMVDGQQVICGYDRGHNPVSLAQLEADRQLYDKTDAELSVYVFRKGLLYLELAGGDFTKIRYDRKNKILVLGEGTRVYHLDRDGSRDALVDPYTGMAYVRSDSGQVLVWAVHVHRDEFGSMTSRDKRLTSRIATIQENQEQYQEKEILEVENFSGREIAMEDRPSYAHTESGFITGSWSAEDFGSSHPETGLSGADSGKNQNGEIILSGNTGSFRREMDPIYDVHGRVIYYPDSGATYEKGTALYDRNGDFVRYRDSDHLERYNQASYGLQEPAVLYDSEPAKEEQERAALHHRLGESYLLENVWMTSERTPNDPFQEEQTEGQPDLLKRVPAGTYIMEELHAPEGYLRGMPVGVLVQEQVEIQKSEMTDRVTKAEFVKLDGDQMVPGASLALFEAERVATADWKNHPKGYYLRKKTDEAYLQWTTGRLPFYVERIPQGDYILEEQQVPSGFVCSEPMELTIEHTSEVQVFVLEEEHTCIEVEKYEMEGTRKKLLPGAGFALYDGASDRVVDAWTSGDIERYRDFIPAFEAMYREYGAAEDAVVCWESCGREYGARTIQVERSEEGTIHPVYAVMVLRTEEGKDIRIQITGEYQNRGGIDFAFTYQFEYQKLSQVNEYAASWLTLDGVHRIEYLPAGASYRLVETVVPYGYRKAEDVLVEVPDTAQVRRYLVENQPGRLLVSKSSSVSAGELPGAHLALYHAAEDGSLVMDASYLVTDWISGSDGYYTEQDYINSRIPDGYQIGDLRLHEIRCLDSGGYWLVELESPAYYQTMEPMKLWYDQTEDTGTVQAENRPLSGSLIIRKTAGDGETLLTGVVFELQAYRKDSTIPVFTRQLADMEGVLQVTGLPVGEPDERGNIIPYEYKLREMTPPEGYAVSDEIFCWEFDGKQAKQEYVVKNQKTKLFIGKKVFRQFGISDEAAFVPGAGLAVYEIRGYDERGYPIYDAGRPKASWITSAFEPYYTVEGLTAGCSYLLKEWKVPEGYQEMKPVLFTVSLDGRGIARMTDQLLSLEIHTVSNAQKQEQLVLQVGGRFVRKMVYELADQDGTVLASWTGSGEPISLGMEQALEFGLREGDICVITEKACYSDGSQMVSSRTTRRLIFQEHADQDETGQTEVSTFVFLIPVRTAVGVKLTLESDDGNWRNVWYPDEEQVVFLAELGAGENSIAGESCTLTEEIIFRDGTRLQTHKLGISWDEDGHICQLAAADRQTAVRIMKMDKTRIAFLPGNRLCIRESSGAKLAEWISGEAPYELIGILETDTSYLLEELSAAEGYQQAEAIPFTVSSEGVWEQVVMVNLPIPEPPTTENHPKPGGGGGTGDHPDPRPESPSERLIPEFPFGRKIGTISAVYQPEWVTGTYGTDRDGSVWLRFLPALGDESEPVVPIAILMLSVIGVLWCVKKETL